MDFELVCPCCGAKLKVDPTLKAIIAHEAPKVVRKFESVDDAMYVRRHLRVGWWSCLLFATFGLFLESLQGFKIRAYLDVSNETRRLMWTLAHAHGALLGLVNVLVGLSIRIMPEVGLAHRRLTSAALLAATVLIPGGFFLGGVVFYGGDPGLGVLILPIGAVALLVAAFRLARTAGSVSSAAAAPSIRAARPPKR